MKFTHRLLESHVLRASRAFPALLITGPRRSGKTTLLRKLFPKATYVLLEDSDLVARANADPRGFLDSLQQPVILDEIQNTPFLFNYIRTRIDEHPQKKGRWLLTGSQEAPLMQNVSESMAGRVVIFELFPFSEQESKAVSIFHGGFPEVLEKKSVRDLWFRSYIQTYLERDVRAVTGVRNLGTFRRFLSLVASRCGQLLNKTELAGPLGIAVSTVDEWLNILEVTSQIILIQPYFENFGKRLIKSPKLYWADPGLACYLLGIESEKVLRVSPFLGNLFEGWVASELIKFQINQGKRKELYYFRDQQGLEVDFILPRGNQMLHLIEAKATHTPQPVMAKPMQSLSQNMQLKTVRCSLVYGAFSSRSPITTLAPNVDAVSIHQLIQNLSK